MYTKSIKREKNLIAMKQCNYIKCNKKDLESYKVCKQCKSAFYCCRKHQKLGWNAVHREYCVKNEKRVYFRKAHKMEIVESERKIAMRLFT